MSRTCATYAVETNAYRISVRKHEGKPLLETKRHRWEDNITTNLIDGMYQIHVAQYTDKMQAVLNMALNLWVS